MATVATKMSALVRKRGVLLLVISAISAVLSAKVGHVIPQQLGFWDGPS